MNRHKESLITIAATPTELVALNAAIVHYLRHFAGAPKESVERAHTCPILEQWQKRVLATLSTAPSPVLPFPSHASSERKGNDR